jgi:delta24-sterol reductase
MLLLPQEAEEYKEELIPIREYLMRHDRAMCMTMGTLVPYGNHWLFRLLLGWLLPPQLSFLKASHTQQTREASIRKQCYQVIVRRGVGC